MSQLSFCNFLRIDVRLTLARQVTYDCFSFTAVPQKDFKHFNLESSLGYAWLPDQSMQTDLDASPEPESHGLCGGKERWPRENAPFVGKK